MALTDQIFATYVIAEEAVREIFRKIKQRFDLERVKTTEDIKAVEDKFDAIVSDNLTYDDLENIFFEPVVRSIEADTTGENVILSAQTDNIKEDEEVTWHIYLDSAEEPVDVDSKGTVLQLTMTQTEMFNNASVVEVMLSCSDYDSQKYTVKEGVQPGYQEIEEEEEA
jgi:hypothetical protein